MSRKTIVFYGDSNSFGTKPMIRHGVSERYNEDERWTGIIRKALQDKAAVIEEGLPSRTTVHDDPVNGVDKNGLTYLRPCLLSHRPVDIVVLMLGTNDLKARFSVTPLDIAFSVERLILEIRACQAGPEGRSPELVLLAPAPILEIGYLGKIFAGGAEKSRQLAAYYQQVAEDHQAWFLNVGTCVKVSQIDGVHYDADQLPLLADAVLALLCSIL